MMSDHSHARWLFDLARPQRARLVASALLGAAAAAASVALMGTAAYLIARASEQPPILTLTVAIVAVRFFGISRAVARYSERLVGHDAAFRVVSDLRVAVYERVKPLVPARIDGRTAGDVLTRFSTDVETVSDAYLRVFPPFAVATGVGALSVVVLAVIDPWVGLALAVGLSINIALVPRLVASSGAKAQATLSGRRTTHSDQVLELLEVLPETWVAETSGPFVERVRAERHQLLKAELQLSTGAGAGQALGTLVAGLTVFACLTIGTVGVQGGGLDGVLLAVVVLTPLAAIDVTAPLPDAVRRWGAVTAATARIRELIDAEPAVSLPTDATSSLALPEELVPDVAADAISVRWPGAERPALHEVSIRVPDGSRVAVVGPSGSGKSTLAMTLAGFLTAEAGTVRLGTVDAAALSKERWHATVGLLEQRPYLFDTTLAENLLLAEPTASRAALDEAVRRVGLSPWVERLPRGLDTPVGEHGRQLSGGQRQRLGLARLLLAKHPIVVLDEPDEHLDAVSADVLMADLLDAAGGRTTVVISHRLVPLAGVDHIVVLDGGRVIEEGDHGALVARGGWYARTWMREQEIAAAVGEASAR
jgi:ATP-binding cassette subfamily C protein CydCD